MTRREFAAAIAAAGLLTSRTTQAAAFPVHYARPNPFDEALKFLEPGTDEFKSEKAAVDLESRLTRIFLGLEPAPANLRPWLARRADIRAARFFALPESQVRFEIKHADAYHTGIWRLPNFEPVTQTTVKSPRPYFRDVTSHVFGNTPSFKQQLLPGNLNWRSRLDSAVGIDVYGNQGIAVGDIDNCGTDEIYVCQPGGLPNRLYKLRPDGSAEDITARAGLGILDDTTSALFADFRNSGKQDLVVLRASGPLLYLNQGDGVFHLQPDAFQFLKSPQGSFTGMAAADYNRDGRLDLYLCCYVYFQSEDQYQFPAPYHDARNGPPNYLMRNRATPDSLIFEDATAESGIDENNDRFSFAPAWCDTDGTGWPSLYVANDFGRNNFYRNRAGKFRDEAAAAAIEDIGPGMSASWFDYDGDGRPDLYVSNMWTAAGQRVVRDPAFKPATENAEAYRRHTKGNSLYRNKGDGTFEEMPREGVEMGRWAWGSGGFDLDLDGTPEILIASGMTSNNSRQDAESFFWRQVVAKSPSTQTTAPDYENGWSAINQVIREDHSWSGNQPNVFYKRQQGAYKDASGISGLDFADDTRAFAVTDFDGDGIPDLILKNRQGPQIRALQNDSTEGRPAIAFRLQGTKSNRDAIGARVEVNGHMQFMQAGSGFLSQHSKTLHFGLANQPQAQVQILWPSGTQQHFTNLEPGHTYLLIEGADTPTRQSFRPRVAYPNQPVTPNNAADPEPTWLLEPVPLPDTRKGPGFLLLHAGPKPNLPASLPLEAIDLNTEPPEVAATYALFRRYLTEYRTGLMLPLLLLIDAQSRAHKIYPTIPTATTLADDLKNIDESAKRALPFPGTYISQPRRNYFKLGAAFYWAGYPNRALPYIQETLRAHPENWRALLALARIEAELGKHQDALATYQRLLQVRENYAPALTGTADAMNQLGVAAAERNNTAEARQWFERAIATQRDHAGAINNLGVLFAKLGKQNDSVAAFLYGLEVAPDDETLYLNLGRIYVTMDERDKARGIFSRLLERKPSSSTATRALAELERR